MTALTTGSSERRAVGASSRPVLRQNSVERDDLVRGPPAVGEKVAVMTYATVGDVSRFPDARRLVAYAGLVPSVRQSGQSSIAGAITKEGSLRLRCVLVQAGHILLAKCNSDKAAPLQTVPKRVHATRARRKIAVVAAARHILRVAYYVLRDGTSYNPKLLGRVQQQPAA